MNVAGPITPEVHSQAGGVEDEPLRRIWAELRHEAAFERASLPERLEQLPHRFDFFHALRLLDAHFAVQQFPRIGCSRSRAGDPVHFGQRPFSGFAPRTIDAWHPDGLPECKFHRPVMLVYFFGLFGPNGALPFHLTELALDLHRQGDFTLTNFANIFHHRFIVLFYRAWASTRVAVDLNGPDQQRFASFIGSFLGEGTRPMQLRHPEFQFGYQRAALPGADFAGSEAPAANAVPDPAAALLRQTRDWPKLFFAGRLSSQARNADGLEAIVGHYFGVPTRVLTFFGRWFDLPSSEVCTLEYGGNAALGRTTIAGTQFWDCQMSFRLRLGPMKLAEFKRLLPDGGSFQRLKRWVFDYVGDQFYWDVQLVLDRREIPDTDLSGEGFLGWTTFLTVGPCAQDSDDLVLCPEEIPDAYA